MTEHPAWQGCGSRGETVVIVARTMGACVEY